MKQILTLAAFLLIPISLHAQVNAVITDGKMKFAEGVLTGYTVQAGGRTICENPIAWGKYIACNGKAAKKVWVNTNGVLGDYVVVDKAGKKLCSNPSVWKQFRGPKSLIVCD